MKPRYDFVLFDADETLFDFRRSEREALAETLKAYGYPTDQAVLAVYHRHNDALWRAFEQGEVTQPVLLEERFARFQAELGGNHDPAAMNRDYLAALGRASFLLPGALELCQTLASHCTLAIVTNGAIPAQRGRFDRSPIKSFFSDLIISQEIGCRKPEPAFFDTALARLGLADRRRAVVVGDSLASDIQGAINSGIDSIWYSPNHGESPLPTYTVTSLDAIPALILGE